MHITHILSLLGHYFENTQSNNNQEENNFGAFANNMQFTTKCNTSGHRLTWPMESISLYWFSCMYSPDLSMLTRRLSFKGDLFLSDLGDELGDPYGEKG